MLASPALKKILVPLDGSELAEQILPYARRFAGACTLSVELLQVNDPDSLAAYAPPLRSDDYLKQTAKKYCLPGAAITTKVELGQPAQLILECAKDDPSCLIAMATHGMSGIRRWVLGSVAGKVVQSAVNPLLIVRPLDGGDRSQPVEFKTVFVPLDGSGLAEKVLPYVVMLAKLLKLEVQLVRVFEPPPNAYVLGDGVIPQGSELYREKLKREAQDYLDGKVQELCAEGWENVMATAIAGDAANEIIDLACRTENTLIAMTSHGRSGVGSWMLGSVAEKVIHHSRDPVLLIRAA